MKIIQKNELIRALEIVKPGLANTDLIEQATSFAFMEGRVVTYNDEISLSHPVENLDINGAIQADQFYVLLKKMKKDEIEIGIDGEEVQLKCGRVKAGLLLKKEIKLPLEEIGEIQTWKEIPDDFAQGLSFATPCCSKDLSRPILTCVHVSQHGLIESCDSYRMTQYRLNNEMPISSFLLPARSAIALLKIKPKYVAEGDAWVHFKTEEDTIFSTRIFKENYVDISSFLKVEGKKVLLPSSLLEILDRAYVVAKRDYFLDEAVKIEIEDRQLTIKSESEVSWFEETSNIKYTGEAFSFTIIPLLLKDILKETNECVIGGNRMLFCGDRWDYVSILKKMI